ncbi:MAG: carboxypeptidase regulatory-like domain-containing protein [Planctomycetaceae bacterium]|nr:carboxypeptidase regulatory-like domain-containing protein [Planctomycetaceae bacterium]
MANTDLWSGKPLPKKELPPKNDVVPFHRQMVTITNEPVQEVEYRALETVECTIQMANDFMETHSVKFGLRGQLDGQHWDTEHIPVGNKSVLKVPVGLKNAYMTLYDDDANRYFPMKFRMSDSQSWSNNWYARLGDLEKSTNFTIEVQPYQPGVLKVACLEPDGKPLSQNSVSVKYKNVAFEDPKIITINGDMIYTGIERYHPSVEFAVQDGQQVMWRYHPVLADEEFVLSASGFDDQGWYKPVEQTLALKSGELREMKVTLKEREKKEYTLKINSRYFLPFDPEGWKKLDALMKAADKDSRSDDEIIETVRNGLLTPGESKLTVLRWFGNKYIWGKNPQNLKAIELMREASKLDDPEIYRNAVYFGLSVVNEKTPDVLQAMVDVAMKTDDYVNTISRIEWGCKGKDKAAFLELLKPYLESTDEKVRTKAENVQSFFNDPNAWFARDAEKTLENAKKEFGPRMEEFKEKLLTGDSETRYKTLTGMESAWLLVDDSFLEALTACAKDTNPKVRRETARYGGQYLIWNAKEQSAAMIPLMITLSKDSDPTTQHYAVYFGLSTVRNRTDAQIRELLELALDNHEPNTFGRIVWGLKSDSLKVKEILEQWKTDTSDSERAKKAAAIYPCFVPDESGNLQPFPTSTTVTLKEREKKQPDLKTLQLTVVDARGNPVPGVEVELRMSPQPKEWTTNPEQFVRTGRYGAVVKTDAQGLVPVQLPDDGMGRLECFVQIDHYTPFVARWGQGGAEQIPAAYTIRLDDAATVGACFIDENGKPVEGVEISPRVEFKKREGDLGQLGMGKSYKSNQNGNWTFASAPMASGNTPGKLGVEISHPDFMPLRMELPLLVYSVDANGTPNMRIALETGYTVTGTLTDQSGKPIAGGTVRAMFANIQREAKTDENGVYRLTACPPGKKRIIAAAKTFAPEQRQVEMGPDGSRVIENTDFQLMPGGTITVRVTEKDGTPIPQTRIFFQAWKDVHSSLEECYGLDMMFNYTNNNGVWVWHESPPDGIRVDICAPDKMQLGGERLIPRDGEYLFVPPPELVVTGKVTDAETGKPVPKMTVVPAWYDKSEPTRAYWEDRNRFESVDGKYRFATTSSRFAHGFRIEAEGYEPFESRPIKSDEGAITIDVALKKGKDILTTVLNADGKPVAGADVLLGIAGAQIFVNEGEAGTSTYCDRQKTRENGQFSFPPQKSQYELIVLHDDGVAWVFCDPNDPPKTITLERWAKIEGTLKLGDPKTKEEKVIIWGPGRTAMPDRSRFMERETRASINFNNMTTVAPDGTFRFTKVLPGELQIGRYITYNHTDHSLASTMSHSKPITVAPGETKQIDIGGGGRTVVGKLAVPEDSGVTPDWNFSLVTMKPVPPKTEMEVPMPIATAPVKSDETVTRSLAITVEKDGTFQLECVPVGEWQLNAELSKSGPERNWPERIGSASTVVTVTEDNAKDTTAQPLDLGVLTMEMKK